MLSELKPRYAGYVAWRGVVPESEDTALGKWESAQLTLGRQLEAQGRMLGNRSQFS